MLNNGVDGPKDHKVWTVWLMLILGMWIIVKIQKIELNVVYAARISIINWRMKKLKTLAVKNATKLHYATLKIQFNCQEKPFVNFWVVEDFGPCSGVPGISDVISQ